MGDDADGDGSFRCQEWLSPDRPQKRVARFILPGGERYEIEFWQDRLEGRPVTCVVPHRAGSPGRLAWEDCNKGAGRVSRCHQGYRLMIPVGAPEKTYISGTVSSRCFAPKGRVSWLSS